MIKKILKYIFRGWKNETSSAHSKLKILPPIFFDLMAILILLSVIIALIKWAFNIA
jgi:hypothetical protein